MSSGKKEETNEHTQYPVIGLNFFKNKVLTLNFSKNEIIISEPNETMTNLDPTWKAIPFQHNEEGIVINMTDGVKEYKMILDTAASISIIKQTSLTSQTIKVDDTDSDSQFVVLKNSASNLDHVKALIYADFPKEFASDGLVGVDFLNSHTIKIDFKHEKMWVQSQHN